MKSQSLPTAKIVHNKANYINHAIFIDIESMPIQNNSLMKTVLTLPTSNFRQFILDLAARNNITNTRTVGDAWAEAVTRISGDDVRTDEIDDLLVAMKKAGVISAEEMIQLLIGYMREIKTQ